MNYSKESLSQYLNKILGVFEGFKVGQGGYFTRTWYNERMPEAFKKHLFDVINVLAQNKILIFSGNGELPFLTLGEAGYDYMQGADLPLKSLSLNELIDLDQTSARIYERIWDFIGKEDEAPFYLGGPDFFNTIASYVGLSSLTYSSYIDDRRKHDEKTSRINWYRELFLKIKSEDIPVFLTDLSNTIIRIYQPLFTHEEELLDTDDLDINSSRKSFVKEEDTSVINCGKVIFISYTWEQKENPGHKEWVKSLADRLKSAGFDVRFDQYQPFGTNMDHFMVESVKEADRIILICTPIFKHRSDNMVSAAGFEASLISNDLIKNITSTKFLPIIRYGQVHEAMPLYLGNRNALLWYKESSDQERFNRLIEDLKNTNN